MRSCVNLYVKYCRALTVLLELPDGVMALEKIEEEIPDFIITDIMMPRMDGIELIRHIKENVNTCDIPLIILSAKSSVEDRIQCLQLGD